MTQMINLLPDVQQAKQKSLHRNALALTIFVVTTISMVVVNLGLLGFNVVQSGIKSQLKEDIETQKKTLADPARFEVNVTDPRTGKEGKLHIEFAGKVIQNQFVAISDLTASKLSWEIMLTQISQVVPEGVQLTALNVGTDNNVSVTAIARDNENLGKFISGLKTFTLESGSAMAFQNIVLSTVTRQTETGNLDFVVEFTASTALFKE